MTPEHPLARLESEYDRQYFKAVGYASAVVMPHPGEDVRTYFRVAVAAAILHDYAEHLWSLMGLAFRDDGHGIAPWAALLGACDCPDLDCESCVAIRAHHPRIEEFLSSINGGGAEQ